MAKTDLTAARLREILHYDPETGVFTWVKSRGRAKALAQAGAVNVQGYTQISIFNHTYKAHRLAWIYVHGCEPPRGLDHINRVKTDNRMCNLRLASDMENGQNRSRQSNNLSGFTGVSYFQRNGKWRATIRYAGKQHHLGLFATAEDAAEAYSCAKIRLHTFNPITSECTTTVESLAGQAAGHAADAVMLLESWPKPQKPP